MVSNSQWGVRGRTLIILLLWPSSDQRATVVKLGVDTRLVSSLLGKPCNILWRLQSVYSLSDSLFVNENVHLCNETQTLTVAVKMVNLR